jgi:hypothetical protein
VAFFYPFINLKPPFMHLLYRSLLSAIILLEVTSYVKAQQNIVITSPTSQTPGGRNTVVGFEAGAVLNPNANYNTLVGYWAGYNNTGSGNSFFGASAGQSNKTGNSNVFIGQEAGYYNTAGSVNVFVGVNSGRFSKGSGNTLLGNYANALGIDGSNNTAVGQSSLSANNSVANVAVGVSAGGSNMNGALNTYLGARAGGGGSTGSNNVAVGDSAGYSNIGSGNVFLGSKAGSVNQTGAQNTFLGNQAGFNTNASANTFIGYQAGRSNTGGQFNTFMGVNAGISNTTGNSNFMLGTNAGSSNTTGTANFFVGDNAGGANTTGGFNVFLGTNAGVGNTVGANNTAIGFEANVGSGALVNATAIGFRAVASASNSLVLGNGANVGIGTSAPSAKLHLVTGTANQSGLRLENLTSNSPASATSQTKFLTVDGSGNVVLGSTTSGGWLGADLWQRNGSYLQSTDDNAVIIGQGISKTPIDYNLFVSKGILTEKVKVAVKNASEWSDYVFAPSYRLAPLSEVARFIQINQHLPGVPSAAEVVEQGVDMAKMDAKLLAKIEELTLYNIQLEKELQATKQQQQTAIDKQQTQIDDLTKLVKQLLERK